jgi:hypothetical protein
MGESAPLLKDLVTIFVNVQLILPDETAKSLKDENEKKCVRKSGKPEF